MLFKPENKYYTQYTTIIKKVNIFFGKTLSII